MLGLLLFCLFLYLTKSIYVNISYKNIQIL